MKRWVWYVVIIGVVAALSGKSTAGEDIGTLQPVQTVRLSCVRGQVCMETDTGDVGVGEDLKSALEDMKGSASGEIFLDTADYLIISPACIDLLPAMNAYLRPSCAVCMEEGETSMEQVGLFLQQHTPETTLMKYRAGDRNLQTLVTREGRMHLVS